MMQALSVILPARCLPPDFVNPFLDYRLPATTCAVLLVALFLVVERLFAGGGKRRGGRWLLLLRIPAVIVVLVAGWVWLQNVLWLPWCSVGAPFGTDWRFGLQEADGRLLPWAVQVSVILTILTFVGAALWLLTRRDRQNA